MKRIQVDPVAPDSDIIAHAADILRAGGLVAFPTETVYGLGANALDPAAIARIYAAKGRPAYNPLIVHISDEAGARAVVAGWDSRATQLARAFWPGPLTIVLAKGASVPDAVSAGLPSVAVRVPAHPVARALLAAAAIPIAAPSANRSTMLSPTTGDHVAKSLGDVVDLILDAGPTPVGIESTVIDLSGPTPTLLRPGTITIPEIEAVIGPIAITAGVSGSAARPSPGMLDRHYAPRARLLLVDAPVVSRVVDAERAHGRRVGALVLTSLVGEAIRMPRDPSGYAARLFGALHALDDDGCDVIVVERVPDAIEWLGVRDRLTRAAQ